jgi:hypothetical protein
MDTPNYSLMHPWIGSIKFQFLNVENQYLITNVTSTQFLQSILNTLKKSLHIILNS